LLVSFRRLRRIRRPRLLLTISTWPSGPHILQPCPSVERGWRKSLPRECRRVLATGVPTRPSTLPVRKNAGLNPRPDDDILGRKPFKPRSARIQKFEIRRPSPRAPADATQRVPAHVVGGSECRPSKCALFRTVRWASTLMYSTCNRSPRENRGRVFGLKRFRSLVLPALRWGGSRRPEAGWGYVCVSNWSIRFVIRRRALVAAPPGPSHGLLDVAQCCRCGSS
jgi:hypothetical protein